MKKLLVVIDMQNDFIVGALGSPEAQAIVPKVVEKIKSWDGDVVCTLDTHGTNYMNTLEGKYLPIEHCIEGSIGWEYNNNVAEAVQKHPNHLPAIFKPTFGSIEFQNMLITMNEKEPIEEITFVGIDTSICVLSNVILAKAALPETNINVIANCCASISPAIHNQALEVMKICQVNII